MLCKYSNFSFSAGECMVTYFGQRQLYNQRGRAQTMLKRAVLEGEIIASGQDAINSRAAEILNAFSLEGGTFVQLKDDGTETVVKLDGPSSRGVRILENTLLQEEGKAHFATGLPFRITLEGEYGISDGDGLIHYEETISVIGNGSPRRVWVETDNSTPIRQIVSQYTAVTVQQSGVAVGATLYPAFNDPIFPGEVDHPDGFQQARSSPRVDGLSYVDWPVRWNYRMTLDNYAGIPNPLIR